MLFLIDDLLDRHWWDIILTNSAEQKRLVTVCIDHDRNQCDYCDLQTKDSSYLQSLQCHLHCRLLLWLWRLSLFGSCALPSAWSWRTAAPPSWSLHPRPCQTNQGDTWGESRGESDLRVWTDYGKRWTLTSLKASFSSFTPIIPAVSARSLGVIKSTKSSKSTLPPTWGKNQRKDAEIKTSVTLCWSYIFSIASWHFQVLCFVNILSWKHQLRVPIFCPFLSA